MKIKVHCKQRDGWQKVLLVEKDVLRGDYLVLPFAENPQMMGRSAADIFDAPSTRIISRRFRFVRETTVRDLVRGTQTTELWAEEE